MRFTSRRPGVSSIVGSIFFVLIMIVAIASLVTIFNSFTGYNQQVTKAGNAAAQVADTQLSVTSGQFGAYPTATSPINVATTACTGGATTASTFPTNREKVFYTANMWWDFFFCNGAFQYSTSFDGVTWQTQRSIPSVITAGYTVGPYFDVEVVGTTLYLAIAEKGVANFQLGIGNLAQGGTNSAPAGTISWTDAPAQVATFGAALAFGPINMAVDSLGDQWVAVLQGTCTTAINCAIAVYEHQACATASATGWEPNACNSATGPGTYAPTALGTLSVNTHMIMFPSISTYSPTGVILLYEYGSATANTIGTLGLVTQSTLGGTAGAGWTTITLTGISAYSLTSSSAALIGTTLYFAGLTGTVGLAAGSLDFWSLPFTSMTVATPSAQQVIEAIGLGSLAWQGALAYSGTTLALFDNPTASIDTCPAGDTCIQYHTSSTLGSTWSSAILLDSAETAVSGLSPASGAIAVTWTNAAPAVRFAALSTFTLSNASPFGVHIVDAYIYNPSSNLLLAHWYYNTTGAGAEDFDYWVGQGSTMVIPIRFSWAANTAYLITFSTDAGVTAQTTLTTLPGGTVSCPSGSFFSQLSPSTQCNPASGSTNPILVSGAGTSTCTDTTLTTSLMMGMGMSYTTSASTSGNFYLSFAFQVASPATSGVTSTWQLFYGSGTAPACNAAATGTALGQAFVVRSQAAVARDLSQSVSTTISGLAPSTTYWFDVQASDSSTGAWVYSNPDMGVVEVQSTNSPTLSTSTNTNGCTDTTLTTAHMMGFGTTFTTPASGFGGSVFGKLTFNVAGPATAAISSRYTVTYGSTATPTCNAGASGTTSGNQYTVTSQAGVASGSAQKAGFVLTGLAAGTTYWVDVQVSDTSTGAWVYSNPVLAVMMMPTATNSLPNAAGTSNTNTCTDATATTYEMMGLGVKYVIPSSAEGDLYLTVTFEVTIPATSGVNSQWQVAYDTGVGVACNTAPQGIQVGNTYTVTSQSGVNTGALSQSETFVLPDLQKIAGATIWIDVEAYDSTAAGWTYSNPEVSVAMFPA